MKHSIVYKSILLSFLFNNVAIASTQMTTPNSEIDNIKTSTKVNPANINSGTTPHTKVMTIDSQSEMTPQSVLQRLKDGNKRFSEGKMKNRDLLVQANKTATSQHPVAVVLSCLDSRTSPDIVFDQGIGDIFVARIAGNIQNNDILGSMEFATKLSGAKLIVVVGHTRCGAIRGACQHAKLGHLTSLLNKIKPALDNTYISNHDNACSNYDFIDQTAKKNVLLVIKQIKSQSPVINQLIREGKVGIVGGIQDVSTGVVTFFEDKMIMPGHDTSNAN